METKMLVRVDGKMLKVAQMFTDADDPRPYLAGIHFEPAVNSEGILVVATDGPAMFVGHAADGEIGGELPSSIELPSAAFDVLPDGNLEISKSPDDETLLSVRVDQIEYIFRCTPHDGFPIWRKVCRNPPEEMPRNGVPLGPVQLQRIAKAARQLGNEVHVRLWPTGNDPRAPMMFRIDSPKTEAVILLMPITPNNVAPLEYPDWMGVPKDG